MPHSCVKCKRSYPDDSKEILEGCECGSKAFFYVKFDDILSHERVLLQEAALHDEHVFSLSDPNKDADESRLQGKIISSEECIEVDVDGLLNKKEAIRSSKSGVYTLDVEAIFAGKRPKL